MPSDKKTKRKKLNKKEFYLYVSVVATAFCATLVLLAYYMIGVLEGASMNKILQRRIDKVQMAMLNSEIERSAMEETLETDALTRAKSFALMLIHTDLTGFDIELIEEIRIAMGLEECYITDGDGIIITGTDSRVGASVAELGLGEEFLDAAQSTSKGFSQTCSVSTETGTEFFAAASRLDSDGIVIVKIQDGVLGQAMQLAGIAQVTSDYPIFKNGSTAIIDIESWKYLSHTDEKYVGESVQIPLKRFKKIDEEDGSGYFNLTLEGEKAYIYYEAHGDKLLLANVPSSEMFARRNFTVGALIICMPIICFVIILATRKKLIDCGAIDA